MADFLERQRTLDSYWRAVILFGRNVASYKFALAKSLIELRESYMSGSNFANYRKRRLAVRHERTTPNGHRHRPFAQRRAHKCSTTDHRCRRARELVGIVLRHQGVPTARPPASVPSRLSCRLSGSSWGPRPAGKRQKSGLKPPVGVCREVMSVRSKKAVQEG